MEERGSGSKQRQSAERSSRAALSERKSFFVPRSSFSVSERCQRNIFERAFQGIHSLFKSFSDLQSVIIKRRMLVKKSVVIPQIRVIRVPFFALCVLFLNSCNSSKQDKEENGGGAFKKHALNPVYAKGFSIYENETTIRLTSRNPDDTTQVYKVLEFAKKDLPFKNIAITSTTHAFLFDAIGANNCIKGMSAMSYLLDSTLKATYAKNGVVELGKDDKLNREIIIKLNPQILMVYPCNGCDYSDYEKAGIIVVNNAEYLEQDPLGRAEWIKVAGLLCGKDKEAIDFFNSVVDKYLAIKNRDVNLDISPPRVLLGKPIDNVWHIPGNNSFAARLIKDAGAFYIFSDIEGNNVKTQTSETVLDRARNADIWIFSDYSTNEITLTSLAAQNKIFEALPPFKKKNVIVCNSAKEDFFGKAVIEPQILLEDLKSHFNNRRNEPIYSVYFKKLKEK